MEIVGTVAAVIALAKDIAEVSDSLVRDIRHAPQELIQCCNQIGLISLELNYIERLQKDDVLNSMLSTDEVRILFQAMQIAKNDTVAIKDKLDNFANKGKDKSSVSVRLSWALFDRKSVEGTLDQMQRIESRMAFLLGLFNMHIGIDSRNQNTALSSQILNELQSQKEMISAHMSTNNISNALAKEPEDDYTVVFRHRYSFALSDYWRKSLGSDIELVSSANGYQSAHVFYARIPLLPVFGRKNFIMSLSFRRASGLWPNFSLLGGGLHFINVIDSDSEIVLACQKGDVVAVRKLFLEKKASPSDMTTENSLIYFAITSGSMQLVKFLIDSGAPVSSKHLLVASWRRQPNTARLLLSTKSVDVESLSLNGSTVASFLYGYKRPRMQQTEFLEIIASHSFSHFNTQDQLGWTVLHRAAAWGTADDIKVLSRMNAIRKLRTLRLGWSPLICAVAYRNLDTMRVLFEISGETELHEEQDIRGWNLLHIAIAYGNLDAVPYLLHKKVSLEASSTATSSYVPPWLKDREVRPSEMAQSFGESAYCRWTEQLESAGLAVDIRPEDIDWSLEGPDQAFGECECCNNWNC